MIHQMCKTLVTVLQLIKQLVRTLRTHCKGEVMTVVDVYVLKEQKLA